MRAGLLILAIAVATGCQSAAPTVPGRAALVVHVQAQPKTGTPPPPGKIEVFDTRAPNDNGAFAKVDYSDLGQIVVWLEPLDAVAVPASGPVAIDIDPSRSAPGLRQVASIGQRLLLHNATSSAQTIYSVSDGNDFDFESVPPDGHVEYPARSSGLIEILTNSRGQNAVQIYVAPTSWVRLTQSGTSIRFDNLPPGRYRLVSWHPRLPGSQENLTLVPDRVTETSIKVSVNSLPKVSGAR